MELSEIADSATSLDEAIPLIRALVAINQALQTEVATLKAAVESLQSEL